MVITTIWAFIKCPKKQSLTVPLELSVQSAGEWENSKQAKCTAYTRATAMKSSLRINTDAELIRTSNSMLTLQRSWLYGIPVWLPTLLWLWEKFDEVVNAEDGDGSFGGEFEALCLDHGRLVHTSLAVVSGLAVHQVQTNPTRYKKWLNTFHITRQKKPITVGWHVTKAIWTWTRNYKWASILAQEVQCRL